MPLQLCRVSYLVICIKYDITQTHQEQVQGKPWTSMTGTQVILMSNQCSSYPSQCFPALPSLISWFFLKEVCLGAMTPEPEASFLPVVHSLKYSNHRRLSLPSLSWYFITKYHCQSQQDSESHFSMSYFLAPVL